MLQRRSVQTEPGEEQGAGGVVVPNQLTAQVMADIAVGIGISESCDAAFRPLPRALERSHRAALRVIVHVALAELLIPAFNTLPVRPEQSQAPAGIAVLRKHYSARQTENVLLIGCRLAVLLQTEQAWITTQNSATGAVIFLLGDARLRYRRALTPVIRHTAHAPPARVKYLDGRSVGVDHREFAHDSAGQPFLST
ncbi:hypothetical protein D3C72_1250140 [compost metagenome]